MDKYQYLKIRNAIELDEISYGYRTFALFSESEIDEEQKGYSTDALTGEILSDWKDNWLVIGREDLVGDPLFVDLQAEELPVYTAAHGEGNWNPILVSNSFSGFIESLLEVQKVSNGRINPVELENNPLPEVIREQVLNKISKLSGGAPLEFWESWFEV